LPQNWNYNSAQGKASRSINLYTRNGVSIDCVECYAQFKASAIIKYSVAAGFRRSGPWWNPIPYPYAEVRFMAEISITAIANIDLQFAFNYAYEYSYEQKLASIIPMLDQALSRFSIAGIPLTLRVTYGLDISIGVDFKVAAALQVTVGADVKCSYKFGIYYNYARPSQPNGCRFKYHEAKGFAEASIEVIFKMTHLLSKSAHS
jgi:hypothetical protein